MTRIPKADSSQFHSTQSLQNCVGRVEQLIVSARRVAEEMERLGTGPIFISNQPSFDCALGDLARWGKACEDAFTAKMKEMGFFQAESAAPAARTAHKVAKAKKKRKTTR